LSAFAAAGTVLCGGIGAAISDRDDARPVLAGLAIGPVLGMLASAFFLPQLRTLGGGSGFEAQEPAPLAAKPAPGWRREAE
jgi:hypothetical protein